MTKANGHDPHDNVTRFPDRQVRRERQTQQPTQPKPAHEPAINLPGGVKWLGGLITVIYFIQVILPRLIGAVQTYEIIYRGGFVPARWTGHLPFGWDAALSLVTHMFLHGGWLHLGVNVLSLIAFGAGLEKWIGIRKMLALFFATGMLAAFTQLALDPAQNAPLIGASGAISGLFGVLLIQFHDRGYMGPGGLKKLIPFALIWIGMSLIFAIIGMPGAEGAISWAAHIGGFLAGMALARPVIRSKIL